MESCAKTNKGVTQEKLSKKFHAQYDLDFSQINTLRISGKQLMYQEGDFEGALNQQLFRAFIALEKYEVEDADAARFKANELTCKILKLIYVCLRLRPSYLDSLQEVKDESEIPKLEIQDVLFQIAADIHKLEFFNVDA